MSEINEKIIFSVSSRNLNATDRFLYFSVVSMNVLIYRQNFDD